MKNKELSKGFTLVELIIVIAILAIIMLIATLAYGTIQQRIKIRADKTTCGEIGKALAIRDVDVEEAKRIKLYPEVVEYDKLEDVGNYIKAGLDPQSMPDGGYIVTAIQTDVGKKIIVGIGKNGQEISTDLYLDKDGAGWAWSEEKEVSKFIEENTSKLSADIVTVKGVTLDIMYGDINGDGRINAIDATQMKSYVIGKLDFDDNQKLHADVNLDGVIDQEDADLVKSASISLVTLPVFE